MTPTEFYWALAAANGMGGVREVLVAFEEAHRSDIQWVPVGRPNNRGTIEASADPGRSLVERLTNGIDAVLEAEHERHGGVPACRSPREAAIAWLSVPEAGLAELTPVQRRALAQRVAIHVLEGDGRADRVVEIRDRGIGLTPSQMPSTVLSLNEGNKLQKHYLAGVYGQGGSSTFAVSKYTLIASRHASSPVVGFTVVKYLDLPPEEFKVGHYVYLTLDGAVLQAEIPTANFPVGTSVKHFGYDLIPYPSPLGPNSLYGLLNQVLFDPVLPVWLDNPVNNQRRVIKGSRNALNGAVDEGDENRRGPRLDHKVSTFHTALGEFGRIGIEYWVLERPTQANKRPSAAFVNPNKPIILTLNGQNHAELSQSLIRKDAELPYLTQRLICHIDTNALTPAAKRLLFVSNREDARRGLVLDRIQQELIRALTSDDELRRLNNEAYQQSVRDQDEAAERQMRTEVARLLRLYGIEIGEAAGGRATSEQPEPTRPTHPRPGRREPQPIELREPPTFIRLVWDEGEDITFYPGQRRYLRIETDANSRYHSASNPAASRINIIATDDAVIASGSTPLQGGRMRAIFDGTPTASVGANGAIRVELTRPGLPMLSDERTYRIVEAPPMRPDTRRVSVPPFRVVPVEGPTDDNWTMLSWPDDPSVIASVARMEGGTLVIYYSTAFPKFAAQHQLFERRDPALAASFKTRYGIWLAVHSLLLYQDQQTAGRRGAQSPQPQIEEEAGEALEREERCRIATLAVLFAAREVQMPAAAVDAA